MSLSPDRPGMEPALARLHAPLTSFEPRLGGKRGLSFEYDNGLGMPLVMKLKQYIDHISGATYETPPLQHGRVDGQAFFDRYEQELPILLEELIRFPHIDVPRLRFLAQRRATQELGARFLGQQPEVFMVSPPWEYLVMVVGQGDHGSLENDFSRLVISQDSYSHGEYVTRLLWVHVAGKGDVRLVTATSGNIGYAQVEVGRQTSDEAYMGFRRQNDAWLFIGFHRMGLGINDARIDRLTPDY